MTKLLPTTLFLFLFGLLQLVGATQVRADHIQGGQITYRALGGNQYEVTVSFYRDCSGIALPGTVILNMRQGSCTGPNTTQTLQSYGNIVTGSPYCASVQATVQCNMQATLSNYQVQKYRGIVTLAPAALWYLSVDSCCRPYLANVVGYAAFRFEATLRNLITVPGSATPVVVQNNSPQYSDLDIPIPLVLQNQRNTIRFATSEPDGDSLAYTLQPPLGTCGNPVAYKPYPTTACQPAIIRTSPPCVLTCASTPATYTASLPILVGNDTIGNCATSSTITTRPRFSFDAAQGQFTFTAPAYVPSLSITGLNKYAVVGQVAEYRRLPGSNRRYLIGTVRRDMLVIVVEDNGNIVPSPPVISVVDPLSGAVPTNLPDTTKLDILTCNYSQVRVAFTDPNNLTTPPANPLQRLTVTYTGVGTINNDVLQGGDIGTYTLLRNGTPTPEARLFFQPAAALAGTVVRIPLRIEDDACPTKATQNRIIEIHIKAGRTAQAVVASGQSNLLPGVTPATICGGTVNLNGRVLRPDSIRRVTGGNTVLQRYSFVWTQVYGNGLPPNLNTSTSAIAVAPTVNSRYQLRITPLDGFGSGGGGCGDTTSVVVNVVPRLANSFDIVRITTGRANAPAGAAITPPATVELRNTTPALPATSAFVVQGVQWTYQRVKDAAGNLTTDAPVVFSTVAQPGPTELLLPRSGEYTITLTSALTVRASGQVVGGACVMLPAQRTVVVASIGDVPNIITPNADGLNDTFVVREDQLGGSLQIFNRWGRKVQDLTNYQNTWDAAGQGPGVYYYYLTTLKGVRTKGWVEVVR